jgi:outer membrane protein OmpA-like peptidoglycan-associated protein
MKKLLLLLLIISMPLLAEDPVPTLADTLLSDVQVDIDAADDIGGKRRAPAFHDQATEAFNQAVIAINSNQSGARKGACDDKIQTAKIVSTKYLHCAKYIRDLRQYKHGWEEAVNRYDRLITNIALLSRLTLDPSLSGTSAGRGLLDSLSANYTKQKVKLAELENENYELRMLAEVGVANRDSVIAVLQIELSAVRQKSWDMELRAGSAEADLSKSATILANVEEDLQNKEAITAVRDSMASLFSSDEAEVMFLVNGDIKIRLTGLQFESGSAWIASRFSGLLDRLANAVTLYPASMIKVEGHTDNTGSRQGNMLISQRRADAILKALTERNITKGREAVAIGVGPDRPIAVNDTESGKALNRRIELIIINGPTDSP